MRGRKAKPIEGLHVYDFKQLCEEEGSPREIRRYRAFAFIQEGKSFVETASLINVKLRSLMRWVHQFRTKGLNGLKDQPGRGLKPYLAPELNDKFKEDVIALKNNNPRNYINGKDIVTLLKKKYRIDVSLSAVYGMLKKADLSWVVRPIKQKRQEDPMMQTFNTTYNAHAF